MWYFIEVIFKGSAHNHIFTVGDSAAEAEAIYSGMQKCKAEGEAASIDGTANCIGLTIDMSEVAMFKLFADAK